MFDKDCKHKEDDEKVIKAGKKLTCDEETARFYLESGCARVVDGEAPPKIESIEQLEKHIERSKK